MRATFGRGMIGLELNLISGVTGFSVTKEILKDHGLWSQERAIFFNREDMLAALDAADVFVRMEDRTDGRKDHRLFYYSK